MIDFNQVVRTPPQNRKKAQEQHYLDVLSTFPEFSNKQRDQLLMISWMMENCLLSFKCVFEAEPGTIIIVIDGIMSATSNKKIIGKANSHFIIHSQQLYKTSSQEVFMGIKDSEYLIIKQQDLESCKRIAKQGLKQQEEFFKRCRFSDGLAEEEFKAIFYHGKYKTLHMGQYAYKKGDIVEGFYIVRNGTFIMKKSVLLGNLFYKKVNVVQVGMGEIIGYIQLIQKQQTRNNDLICNSAEGQLIFIPKQYFSIIKFNLQTIHSKRKMMTEIVEKRRLKTLQNVLPYIKHNEREMNIRPSVSKFMPSLIRSFNNNSFQQQTFFKNSYSKSNKSQQLKSKSSRKLKNKQKFMSGNLNQLSKSTNLYTVCQKLSNDQIDIKYQKFTKFRKQHEKSKALQIQIDTPFQDQAKAFRLTYQQQKLKIICQGKCKRNCKKNYL